MGYAQKKDRISVEDYLQVEKESGIRHEYYNGWILAMAGGTLEHDIIGTNVRGHLFSQLCGKNCNVFSADLKIFIESANANVYSDGMVICGQPISPTGNKDRVVNPVWVLEVLSEGTEQNDRGDKFARYQTLSSFREYVLISQKELAVEVFFKQENGFWQYSRYTNEDELIRFHSIGCELRISDIYEGISFAPENS